jgi:hypothetical protein
MSKLTPTAIQINTVIRRAAPISDSGEARLIIAIIGMAVTDAVTHFKHRTPHRHLALQFFREGRYRLYCDLVELDPDWVGKLLFDYAGIECGESWKPCT